jgi:hypothetical protein
VATPPSGFHKILNRHGYGFQYSVLNRAAALYEDGRSQWLFEAAEFPVEVQGSGTRIDFILKHRHYNHLLVAECKRVNPALGAWCFARAPYVRRGRIDEMYFADYLVRNRDGSFSAGVKPLTYLADAFHLGLEARTGDQGESAGAGRNAIEDAATQVCRGVNGLVEFYVRHRQVLKGKDELIISSAIFTTAALWAADVDLSNTDLSTGDVDPAAVGLVPKAYVAYQYHLSPGIKHEHSLHPMPKELGDVLDREYIRTIHVVAPNGVEAFLQHYSRLP